MSVLALGLNHSTAPLDLRGRFAFSTEQLVPALKAFRARMPLSPEAALVSTCNRTELYVAEDPAHASALVGAAVDWLAEVGGVGGPTPRQPASVLPGGAAARHPVRGARGLGATGAGR